MYYLATVKIYAKGTGTKVPYSKETDDTIPIIGENTIEVSHIDVAFNKWTPIGDENFITFFHSNGIEHLGTFKKRVDKKLRSLLLTSFMNCCYEASIYSFKEIKSLVFWAWCLRTEEVVYLPLYLSLGPYLNYAKSVISKNISNFKINWEDTSSYLKINRD